MQQINQSVGRQSVYPDELRPLIALLRTRGMRMTPHRLRMLAILWETSDPISIDGILECFDSAELRPDYTTVLRLMGALEEMRLVRRIGAIHFELLFPGRNREHWVCVICGKTSALEKPLFARLWRSMLARRYRFLELSHSLEFFGRCSDCRAG